MGYRHSRIRRTEPAAAATARDGRGAGSRGGLPAYLDPEAAQRGQPLPAFLAGHAAGGAVYRGLADAFGAAVDDIGVIDGADAVSDGAYERGGDVHLGRDWRADPHDRRAMEVLGHETAHALAPRGGADETATGDSPSGTAVERVARDSGTRFAASAAGDFRGGRRLSPAPAASGGINHFESDEHRRSVDWSSELLELAILNARPESELSPEQVNRRNELRLLHLQRNGIAGAASTLPSEIDPDQARRLLDESAPHLQRTIHLSNGMDVTPGDITALMGDFYGRFEGGPESESLSVTGSRQDIDWADADEMQALLDAFDRERAGEHVGTGEFEGITAGRRDLSYLELAQRNSAHFSSAGMSGTDNNMGAYQHFHDAALDAAAGGDRNRACLLESMAMHYLTDRHAGGHAIDKRGVMEAVEDGGDLTGNMRVKHWHDLLNEHGADSTNANGGSWTAYGDGNWDRAGNTENRIRTAVSVATSWSELDAVLSDPEALEAVRSRYGARATVPAFDADRQQRIENFDDAWGGLGSFYASVENVGQLPGAAWGSAQRAWGQTGNAIEDIETEAARALDWRNWLPLYGY